MRYIKEGGGGKMSMSILKRGRKMSGGGLKLIVLVLLRIFGNDVVGT